MEKTIRTKLFSLKKQLDAIEIEVKKLGKDNIHVLSIEDIESDIKKSSSFEKLSLDFLKLMMNNLKWILKIN